MTEEWPERYAYVKKQGKGREKMTRIFGHRGASGYAPENTIGAFRLAAEMGADGVELDVQMSRDGELVIAHDETVDRVSNGTGRIADLTLAELKKLNFNRMHPECGEARIPTLKEVFELLKPTGMSINIELKNSLIDYPGLEKRVIDLTAEMFDPDRVIFSSFNHSSMLRVKAINPRLVCGLLYEASLIEPWEYALRLGMDALHPHYSEVIIPGGNCRKAHEAGIRVHTWTVNDPETMATVIREKADILITNYPDLACQERAKIL